MVRFEYTVYYTGEESKTEILQKSLDYPQLLKEKLKLQSRKIYELSPPRKEIAFNG